MSADLTAVYASCAGIVRRILFDTLLSHTACGGHGSSWADMHPSVRTLDELTSHAVQTIAAAREELMAAGNEAEASAALEMVMMEALPFYTNHHIVLVARYLKIASSASSSPASAASTSSFCCGSPFSGTGGDREDLLAAAPAPPCPSLEATRRNPLSPAAVAAAASPLRRPPKAVVTTTATTASAEHNDEPAEVAEVETPEAVNAAEVPEPTRQQPEETQEPPTQQPSHLPKTPLRPVRIQHHRRRRLLSARPVPLLPVHMPDVSAAPFVPAEIDTGSSSSSSSSSTPPRRYKISRRARPSTATAAATPACPPPPTTTPEATMTRGGATRAWQQEEQDGEEEEAKVASSKIKIPMAKVVVIPVAGEPKAKPAASVSAPAPATATAPPPPSPSVHAAPASPPLRSAACLRGSTGYVDQAGTRFMTDATGKVRWVQEADSEVITLAREEVTLVSTEVVRPEQKKRRGGETPQTQRQQPSPSSSSGSDTTDSEGGQRSGSSSSSPSLADVMRYRVEVRRSARVFAVRSIHTGAIAADHPETFLTRFDFAASFPGSLYRHRTALGIELVLPPEFAVIEAAATSLQLPLGMTLPAGPDARSLKPVTLPNGAIFFPLPARFPMALLEAYPLAVHFRATTHPGDAFAFGSASTTDSAATATAPPPRLTEHLPSLLLRIVFEDVWRTEGRMVVEPMPRRAVAGGATTTAAGEKETEQQQQQQPQQTEYEERRRVPLAATRIPLPVYDE
jgi:hypothetical protein